MATPFVAGVVALVISVTDFFGMDALRELLLAHAEDAGPPGRDREYGVGLIRPDRMLADRTPPPVAPEDGVWLWVPGGMVRPGMPAPDRP
jgi:hypothetical protein